VSLVDYCNLIGVQILRRKCGRLGGKRIVWGTWSMGREVVRILVLLNFRYIILPVSRE